MFFLIKLLPNFPLFQKRFSPNLKPTSYLTSKNGTERCNNLFYSTLLSTILLCAGMLVAFHMLSSIEDLLKGKSSTQTV